MRSSCGRSEAMELTVVPIVKPDDANFIFGRAHFRKTVEGLHEALLGAVRGIRFGLAFCEASGKRLVRWSGNDEASLTLARNNALAIGAGHTFLIFLGDGFFPVNVLAAVRAVPPHLLRDGQPDTGNRRANGAGPRRARRGGWRLAAGRRNRRRHCVAEGPTAKDRLQALAACRTQVFSLVATIGMSPGS